MKRDPRRPKILSFLHAESIDGRRRGGRGDPALLQVEGLRVTFGHSGAPPVVYDVSFSMQRSEITALVGESGSGKSSTALALTRLPDTGARIEARRLLFEGRDLMAAGERALRKLRGAGLAYVFQDPSTALNPVFRVGSQVREALVLHGRKTAVREEVLQLLDLVGLPDPARCARAFPHQLSGGQQQRVMIAMALACRPQLLVADEPTAALDVTVQAQILALLARLRDQTGMAVLLITHDLSLAAACADRLLVMYAGRLMESGPAADVLRRPFHPYTRALLRSVPLLDAPKGRLQGIPGSPPRNARPPAGCPFHPRCPEARPACSQHLPVLLQAADRHLVRCPYWNTIDSNAEQP